MKLLLTSDLHGHLPVLPTEGWDLLLIAGDICPDYARSAETPFRQALWLNTAFRKWLPQNAFFTWGNHDAVAVNCLDWIDESLRAQAKVDCLTEHDGLHIWWSPWSNKFGWTQAFMSHPQAIQAHYDLIPAGTDLIVSHAPPYGLLDQVAPTEVFESSILADGTEHLGSKELLHTIRRVKPKAIICGHIHGGYGKGRLHRADEYTDVYNVAQMTEAYEPRNPPIIIEV